MEKILAGIQKRKSFNRWQRNRCCLMDRFKDYFPVPLEWKDGYHKIWIEKQIDWDGKTTAKSEAFEIKVLPITGNYTEDDGLYFEQMKTWRPETREVNGYK